MLLWWCENIFHRLAAVWFTLLFSTLLLQMLSPIHATPSCPRSCSCPGVKEVHCTFRHLTTIPKTFPKDTERLNLGYNSLTEVEGSEFRSLQQLEMLMLHGNDIDKVYSGAFYSLRSLQILKLSYNKITLVNPGLFEGLVGLIRLHLDHNLIEFIEPYSFSGLTSLKLLQLEGNLIREIHPHTFITVSLLGSFWTSGLKQLHLSDNLMEQLPSAAFKMAPRLELLTLHGNPWTCDCQMRWLVEWSSSHKGIIKCKKDRGSSEICPQCFSPQTLNGTLLFGLDPGKLTCVRPALQSPLKKWDNAVWAESETEADLPYTRDFEEPLGHLTFVLSDSHGNSAHLACDVCQPEDSSQITWTLSQGELSVIVSLVTVLECEIDRETLQNLWQLVAYYYESPAILERGQQRGNESRVTYQYAQVVNENSPYFTDLKGYLVAEPSWLLQPRITLKLNRQQTTTKKLVMDFTTVITSHMESHTTILDDSERFPPWALLYRRTVSQIQNVLAGSKVQLECHVVSSDPGIKIEWMLPDLSLVERVTDKIQMSEKGKLVILNATLSDSGLYHCMVRTKAGVDLMPLRLTIKERSLGPTAFNGKKIIVEKGNSFSLPCEVTSVQPSQTMWYLPNNQILLPTQQTRQAEVMENGTLVVERLTAEDSGEYSCLASNLYGVNMLSHIVEVTEKKSFEQTKEQKIWPFDVEQAEGSGEDNQKIINPFATQFPKKILMQEKNSSGTSKRIGKPDKSAKGLDLNLWAEISIKGKDKPRVSLPTMQSLPEPSTVSLSKPSPSTTVTIVSYFHDSTPTKATFAVSTQQTKIPMNTETESSATPEVGDTQRNLKMSENLSKFLQHPTSESTPPHIGEITQKPTMVTDLSGSKTAQPLEKLENNHSGEGKGIYNIHSQSNRRGPPYRRRKPQMRRVRPHTNPFYHPPNKPRGTAPPTTTITPITTTTTTTTATPASTPEITTTTEAELKTLMAGYQTEDYEDEHKLVDILDLREDFISEATPTMAVFFSSPTTAPSDQDSNFVKCDSVNPNLCQRQDSTTNPTDKVVNEKSSSVNKIKSQRTEFDTRKKTEETSKNNKSFAEDNGKTSMTALRVQEKNMVDKDCEEKDTEKSDERISQRNSTHGIVTLSTQNRLRSTTRPLQENHTTKTRTSSSMHITSHSTGGRASEEEQVVNKPDAKTEIHSFPINKPVHPWLHQSNLGGGQTTIWRTTHANRDRIAQKHGGVNSGKIYQLPSVPPTLHRPFYHHQHHYQPFYPSWPGQRTITHPRQGSKFVPTNRPWPLPHPWTKEKFVTNRPEITAETLRPTPTISGSTGNSNLKINQPHLSHNNYLYQNPQNHHLEARNQTRDQLFFSRLRNRYRQAQLDRIVPLGRTVTPKPSSSYLNPLPSLAPKMHHPSPHRLFIPKPATTASYSYTLHPLKPAQPSSTMFSITFPTPRPHNPTTPWAQYGGRWPAGGRISTRRPTAVPPFPWVLGSKNGGIKAHITTVATASVSVLAESDVFLPCKATGNPEPNIAWTKVSTGATISADTKHGSRFQVFKDGSFVIKNIQLQDRGQYLCTAQNRFGSDRMVITLAVQTEAPKIKAPNSTQLAVYLGKSLTLDCFAMGKPHPQISWILPDRTFVRDVGTVATLLSPMSLLQNGTLQIHSANFSSKGDYKCIASNAAGADTITYQLHVAALPPTFSEDEMDTVIIQPGSSFHVHCSVKGEPLPTLKWMLPAGVSVKPSQFLGRRLFVFPNGTLLLKNVLPADAGRYECSATNAVGTAKKAVQVKVRADSPFVSHQLPHSPPIPQPHTHVIPSRQHSISAMYGSAVYLHCPESTGSKIGTIWQLPTKTIMEHQYSPERPIKVFRNGTLRILQLTEMDGGNYVCVFQRPDGEDIELFQVEVVMIPPRIEHVRTAHTRVSFGDNFQVDCVATGLPDPDVFWSLPDGTIINNTLQSDDSGVRNSRYIIFGNGTLLFQQVGKKDEGDYTCHAKNKIGKDERKVRVNLGPQSPKISSKLPSVMTVRLGESAKLSCQATGDPPPIIMWITPANDVISTSSDKFQIMDDGILVVTQISLADEGKYACVARNSAGDDVKYMKLDIEPQKPIINDMEGKSTTKVSAVSYQTVSMDCRVKGKPKPSIWWASPNGHSLPTPYLGGRFQVHLNGSLKLRGVRRADEGTYICLAKNDLGEASLLVELDVASLAEKPSFAIPNIEIIPLKQDSDALFLECPGRGKPQPEYAWVLPNGTMLGPGVKLQRFKHHQVNGTLQISQVVSSDKGIYRCLAKNIAGQAEKRYSLEIGRKPVIRGSTGGLNINYGLNLNLPCTVDGWPQASITWSLPNGLVVDKPQTTGRVTLFSNGTLQLRQVSSFDKGTYICKASNSFGSSALSYPVAVMFVPPRITNILNSITRVGRGSPVTLQCIATGIPKPEISWTLPGRTTLVLHNQLTVQGGFQMTEEGSLVIQNPILVNSGIYKCNAKNALGNDFKSTYLQVV